MMNLLIHLTVEVTIEKEIYIITKILKVNLPPL